MGEQAKLTNTIDQVLKRFGDGPARDLRVESKRLPGGTEASAVTLATIRYRDRFDRQQMLRLVVKQLTGRPAREAPVYEQLVAGHASDLAPRLLAIERTGPEGVLLAIEAIRRTSSWPWHSLKMAEELLTRLATFHTAVEGATSLVPEWDFEAHSRAVAEHTLMTFDQCRRDPDLLVLARDFPALARMVHALPSIRTQLLRERPFGCRPIHGDLHPGNVLVRRRDGRDTPVFLDWGRARAGSPLEDVSSWLQSVSYFEAETRRHHDTLLAAYLTAFGVDRKVTDSLRAAYWMAGASNVLSGALLHHLCMANDRRRSRLQREAALRAARDTLRVVRRADAWWS